MRDIASDVLGLRTQGLLTPHMLRDVGVGRSVLSRALQGGRLVRVRPGVYAESTLPALPRFVVTDSGAAPAYVAHVRAALLSLGGIATAAGRTAAALRGWGLLVEPSRTIEVAVPHGRGRARLSGVVVKQHRRLQREPVRVMADADPLWLTSAVRTVIDCCLTLSYVEAVVACDSALRAGDVTLRELWAEARRLPGVHEARRVRRVLRSADPESGSVLESALRCRLLLAGLAGFTTQRVLATSCGRPTLRVDFCFSGCRLVVEADGAKWHQDPLRDRERDNRLACLGYRVLRYTWSDIVQEPDRVVEEIRMALRPESQDIQLVTRGAAEAA